MKSRDAWNADRKVTREHRADANKAIKGAKTDKDIKAAWSKMEQVKKDERKQRVSGDKFRADRSSEKKKYEQFSQSRDKRNDAQKKLNIDNRRIKTDQQRM